MSKSNLAYDLSRYEYSTAKRVPEPKREQVIKANQKAVAKSGSATKTVAAVFTAGMLMCAILYGKAEETTLQAQITALNSQIDIENSEKVRMQTEIEGKTSLQNVEEYAENVLGLKKIEKSQIEYVQLQTDDVVEISEPSTNIFVAIKNKFYDILEYLEG